MITPDNQDRASSARVSSPSFTTASPRSSPARGHYSAAAAQRPVWASRARPATWNRSVLRSIVRMCEQHDAVLHWHREQGHSGHRQYLRWSRGEGGGRLDGDSHGHRRHLGVRQSSPALSSGQYTAVATQANPLVGDPAGKSGPVTFTVTPPVVTPAEAPLPTPAGVPPPAPPLASFKWFPPVPQTGEPVSLVSISTDAASPITGIAWALTSNGPFQGGGAVFTTSFSTPGAHIVRLRVTDAYGLSSVATETIKVIGPAASLMQPFPVVRIAGTETASGVKLTLLRVQQVPAGTWKVHPLRDSPRQAARTRRHVSRPSGGKANGVPVERGVIAFDRLDRVDAALGSPWGPASHALANRGLRLARPGVCHNERTSALTDAVTASIASPPTGPSSDPLDIGLRRS